jgi:hypothetical protein
VAEPPEVVTTTSLTPTVVEGVVIVRDVAVFVSLVASTPPTVTEVAFSKLVPAMTVLVPPAVVPEVTESEVIVGVEACAGRVAIEEKVATKSEKTNDLTTL